MQHCELEGIRKAGMGRLLPSLPGIPEALSLIPTTTTHTHRHTHKVHVHMSAQDREGEFDFVCILNHVCLNKMYNLLKMLCVSLNQWEISLLRLSYIKYNMFSCNSTI